MLCLPKYGRKAPQSRKRPCRAFVKYAAVHTDGICARGRARFSLQFRPHGSRRARHRHFCPLPPEAMGTAALCCQREGLYSAAAKFSAALPTADAEKSWRGWARKGTFQGGHPRQGENMLLHRADALPNQLFEHLRHNVYTTADGILRQGGKIQPDVLARCLAIHIKALPGMTASLCSKQACTNSGTRTACGSTAH